jgi:hypothetical protein
VFEVAFNAMWLPVSPRLRREIVAALRGHRTVRGAHALLVVALGRRSRRHLLHSEFYRPGEPVEAGEAHADHGNGNPLHYRDRCRTDREAKVWVTIDAVVLPRARSDRSRQRKHQTGAWQARE